MLTAEQLAEIEKRADRFGFEYGDGLDLISHIRELEGPLKQPWLTVYLDGRNEHGSHVLPVPGDNIGNLETIVSLLESQEDGIAECIITEAESLGHEVGHGVVTLWSHTFGDQGDYDLGDYWEYQGISEALTAVFCGTPMEQLAALDRAGEEG